MSQTTVHPGVYWRELIDGSPLTQVQIAEQMGVSQKHLSRIVRCYAMPGVGPTIAFARVMHIDPDPIWQLACDHKLGLALGRKDVTPDCL